MRHVRTLQTMKSVARTNHLSTCAAGCIRVCGGTLRIVPQRSRASLLWWSPSKAPSPPHGSQSSWLVAHLTRTNWSTFLTCEHTLPNQQQSRCRRRQAYHTAAGQQHAPVALSLVLGRGGWLRHACVSAAPITLPTCLLLGLTAWRAPLPYCRQLNAPRGLTFRPGSNELWVVNGR